MLPFQLDLLKGLFTEKPGVQTKLFLLNNNKSTGTGILHTVVDAHVITITELGGVDTRTVT